MHLNDLTEQIIGCAIVVHRELGPGLLESVYQRCMVFELGALGLEVQSEVDIPVVFKGRQIHDEGFRMDLLVEKQVVVELKSKQAIAEVDKKQLLTYLKLANKQVGLLINFNVDVLKKGIKRIVNGFPDEAGIDSRENANQCPF